jgi:hypothetical protein
MFAVSTVSHRVATVPTVAKASRASKSRAPVATTRAAAREDSDVAARVMFTGRRSLVAATPDAALAFGSGIPGYDINQKARDAQRDMIKREQTEQRELARKEKERRRLLREQEEAEACAADPSACPTPAEN